MALSISRLADRRAALVGPPIKADRRLYLTADGKSVVEASDAKAATLFVPEGGEISRAAAVQFGLGLSEQGTVVIGGDLADAPLDTLVADRRICLKVDEKTICDETDPDAAVLLVNAGESIDADVVTKLGLIIVEGRVEQSAESPRKEREKAEDKNGDKPEDKSLGPDGDKGAKTETGEKKPGRRGFFSRLAGGGQ